ncbi:hypothetical protein, partial [Thiolapillus sp.]|uniref:hypothetical protein n=1 Tax=Thiolapillus sp. TaxID=2017437 RepID=UPI003AF4D9F9
MLTPCAEATFLPEATGGLHGQAAAKKCYNHARALRQSQSHGEADNDGHDGLLDDADGQADAQSCDGDQTT